MVDSKKKDLAQVHGTDDDADPIIEEMRSVGGVEVSVLFREQKRDYRVSFRSRGTVNVGKLAERLGGGGHFDSSGTVIPKSGRAINAVVAAAVGLLK